MRVALAALLIAFPMAVAQAADFVMIGKQGTMQRGFIGCTDLEDLKKIATLVGQGDTVAAARYATRKSPSCTPVPTGATGTVEHLSAWSSASCIRPAGEPECFWVPMNLVVEKK